MAVSERLCRESTTCWLGLRLRHQRQQPTLRKHPLWHLTSHFLSSGPQASLVSPILPAYNTEFRMHKRLRRLKTQVADATVIKDQLKTKVKEMHRKSCCYQRSQSLIRKQENVMQLGHRCQNRLELSPYTNSMPPALATQKASLQFQTICISNLHTLIQIVFLEPPLVSGKTPIIFSKR